MKLNNHIWQSLEIFGNDEAREIFTSYVNKMIIGAEIKEKSTILFFDNIIKLEIDNILTNNSIKKWEWSEVKEKNWNQACKDFFKPIIIPYLFCCEDNISLTKMITIKDNIE